MQSLTYDYPVTIQETDLDVFGHVNNAKYLVLFEEARWDLLAKNGYSLSHIQEAQIGPVILEIAIQFLKELTARQEVIIKTQTTSYKNKIGIVNQKIFLNQTLCCTADFKMALFDLKQRKIILPTPAWLNALGIVSR